MSQLSVSEFARLHAFAKQTLWLMICALVMPTALLVDLKMFPFPNQVEILLISFAAFSFLVAGFAALIFFSAGGARLHYSYLVVFSLVLYPFCLLCLYTTGTVVYFAATMGAAYRPVKADPAWLFTSLAVLSGIGALVCIYVALSYPGTKAFLKEFQRTAKSNRVRLPDFVFGRSPVSSSSETRRLKNDASDDEDYGAVVHA